MGSRRVSEYFLTIKRGEPSLPPFLRAVKVLNRADITVLTKTRYLKQSIKRVQIPSQYPGQDRYTWLPSPVLRLFLP